MEVSNTLTNKYNFGLALSGGGARGFAHLGVIKALEEYGMKPDVISGVSAGSVVAVLYADGYAPDEIIELFGKLKFSDFTELSLPKDGLFKIDKFKKFIKKNLRHQNLEDLEIPTLICATDLDHGKIVTFREGSIAERVVASCSIPIVFKPVKIDGVWYVDGGVLRNLPAFAIRQLCNTLVGVNVSPQEITSYNQNMVEIAQRAFSFMSKTNVIADMKMCDILIQAREIAHYSIFSTKEIKKISDIGYKNAKATLDAKEWAKGNAEPNIEEIINE